MLKEFLMTGDDEYMKRLTLSKNVAPLVYNSLLSTQDFEKILVYSEKNFSISYDLFKNDSEVQAKEWYRETENTSKTLWWYEEEKEQFFITRCVRDSVTEKKLGIIRIDLKGEILAKSFEIFSGVPVEDVYKRQPLCELLLGLVLTGKMRLCPSRIYFPGQSGRDYYSIGGSSHSR